MQNQSRIDIVRRYSYKLVIHGIILLPRHHLHFGLSCLN